MGDSDSHSGEKVLLYVFVGIGLAALAYLFFKDQFRRDNMVQPLSLQQLSGSGRTTSQLALSNPRIDELEMQTNLLQDKLKLYDYRLSQLTTVNNQNNLNDLQPIPRTYSLSGKEQPARAGSVMTVRTTGEDKVRQKDFGMN